MKLYHVLLVGLCFSGCATKDRLPLYVVAEQGKKRPEVLQRKAKELTLPFSQSDLDDIAILEAKFDEETNCAGLAAPQIGISKAIIVFSAPDDPELKKYRKDFTQTMEKTIWINPSYEGLESDKHRDVEGCFSVKDLAGVVQRYKKIKYKAFDFKKNRWVSGVAEGFLARIIQHEIDHVNGTLCIDRAEKVFSIEEYKKQHGQS